jgi:thymidylate synthase (FAD)
MQIEYVDHMGSDLMVANVARVSMDKYHDVFDESDAKLIKYLAVNGHWSPLSHPKIQVRITLPVFVARQWEKHRVGVVRGYDIFDQNEVSRRYVDSDPTFFHPKTWRKRPEKSIKQGSGSDLTTAMQRAASDIYEGAICRAESDYKALLAMNVAPEQARIILPQAMYTMWIETGSLVYWARVYNLRVDPHAQREIQDLAKQLDPIIRLLFPVSWGALVD